MEQEKPTKEEGKDPAVKKGGEPPKSKQRRPIQEDT